MSAELINPRTGERTPVELHVIEPVTRELEVVVVVAEPEPDEVRSLIQGFARARQPGCPYANVFGVSPDGCRCAHCYQDGSVP